MNDVDIAWFAGLFEGEGCVRLGSQWNTKNGRRYGSPSIYICQVNKEPLNKCLELFPFGHLNGPYKYAANKQEHMIFTVLGNDNVKNVFDKIKPYLSKKRIEQFEKTFEDLTEMLEERANIKKLKRATSKATCHPDRPLMARTMCSKCYSDWYNHNMRKNEK